jgi:hypothetical protein
MLKRSRRAHRAAILGCQAKRSQRMRKGIGTDSTGNEIGVTISDFLTGSKLTERDSKKLQFFSLLLLPLLISWPSRAQRSMRELAQ